MGSYSWVLCFCDRFGEPSRANLSSGCTDDAIDEDDDNEVVVTDLVVAVMTCLCGLFMRP